MLSTTAEIRLTVVCISALPPFAIEHSRALYQKLRVKFPDLNIIICLWHFAGDLDKTQRRLKLFDGHSVLLTLPDVLQYVREKVQRPSAGATSTVLVQGIEIIEDKKSLAAFI